MEYHKGGTVEQAAMKAGVTAKTASKYIRSEELPSDQKMERNWKTRVDPFEGIWSEVAANLGQA